MISTKINSFYKKCSMELKINQEGKSDCLQNVFELRHPKLKNTFYKP